MTSLGGTPDPNTSWWEDWSLSYTADVYGPIYGGHSVQIAMVNTLKTWLPAYTKEANRVLGGDILPIVKTYQRPPTNRAWQPGLDVQICCSVGGTVGKPIRTQSTGYRSTWKATLEIFVYAGVDWQECLALTYAYAAVARGAIIQHGDLGGFAEFANWTGESVWRGTQSGQRWSGIAELEFEIGIFSTVNQNAGPPSPDYAATGTPTLPSLLPIPMFPTVIDPNVTVENQSLFNSNGAPTPI